jgi:hypothetical protein
MDDGANKSKTNFSDILMLKYFTAVNRRNQVSLKKVFGHLKKQISAKRKRSWLIEQTEKSRKQSAMAHWLKATRNASASRDFRYRKALYTVILYFKLWRRLASVRVKAAKHRKLRERETLWRYFEGLRFHVLQQRTQLARFAWTQSERRLRFAIQSWRDLARKNSRLKLKNRLFKIKANRSKMLDTFIRWRDYVNTRRDQIVQFRKERTRRLLCMVIMKWRKLRSSNALLNKLRSMLKQKWTMKIYRAFFGQLKRNMIDRLKSTIKEKNSSHHEIESVQEKLYPTKLPWQTNSNSRNSQSGPCTNGSEKRAISPDINRTEFTRFIPLETYKQRTVQSIVDFRNQASDIKFAYNNLPSRRDQEHFAISQANDTLLSTVKSNQRQPEASVHNTMGRLATGNQDKTDPSHFLNTAQKPHRPSKNLSESNFEQIIQTNVALLEAKMSFLKVNKDTMTIEQRAKAKEEIKLQIEKIKLYQNKLAHSAS